MMMKSIMITMKKVISGPHLLIQNWRSVSSCWNQAGQPYPPHVDIHHNIFDMVQHNIVNLILLMLISIIIHLI